MPGTGKSSRKSSPSKHNQDNKVENRRSFAVIGGIVGVVVFVIYLISAAYPARLFSEVKDGEPADQQPVPVYPHPILANSPMKISSEALVANTDEVWTKLFRKMGKKYSAPAVQLFEDTISAYECGFVLPAAGSFYCPANKSVYLDLAFFNEIKKRFPNSGELVQAYIIAHQAGHHVADLLGITAKVEAQRARLSDSEFKKLTDKEELLADYYAGVWAHYAWKKDLDNGDAELAIGDATMVSTTLAPNNDTTVPDAYSYVNLGNRAGWFYRGFQSGDLKDADGIFEKGDLR